MDTTDRSYELRMGLAALEDGHYAEAVRVGIRLVERQQGDLEAQRLLGLAYGMSGDTGRAAPWLDRAARGRPLHEHPLHEHPLHDHPLHDHPSGELIRLLLLHGRADFIAPQLRIWLERAPDDIRLRYVFAAFQRDEGGSPDEAVALLDPVLRSCPDSAAAHFQMGLALAEAGRFADAADHFRRTIVIDPGPALAWANLGMALDVEGRFDAALDMYAAALARDPNDVQIRTNRAVALLHAGRMAEAWQDDAWRFAPLGPTQASLPPEKRLPPLSHLSDLTGRVVLVVQEEGLGDTIQFLRYLPLLAARGASVAVAVPRALAAVLRTIKGVASVPDSDAPVPDYDFHCSFNNLPRAFETTLATIPASIPYIVADAALAAHWARRLPADPLLLVGLVWAGQARPSQPGLTNLNRRRSMSLVTLTPLAAIRGVRFISLQKGPPAAEARAGGGAIDLLDPMDEVRDFADTAAIIANLDLVISVDTSVVHLAGAMGKPVFLLDRYDNCWRWLSGREDSPWYPSLRIFRQQRNGEWGPVIASVAAALGALAAVSEGQGRTRSTG